MTSRAQKAPPVSASRDWSAAPYSAVAEIYDRLMAHVFESRQRPLLDATIERFGWRPGAWLDLACGTGSVACYLADLGWRVCGMDVSDSMLDAARGKSEELGLDVVWRQGDMRAFRAPFAVDVVSCFFDSINIMTEWEDFVKVFRTAARALKPGGVFLFDAITPRQTRRLWDYCDPVHSGEGFVGMWELLDRPTRNSIRVVMRWFIERDGGLYLRADETHHVRGYSKAEIGRALRETDFALVEAYEGDEGFGAPANRETMRIDAIARKRDAK